MIIELISIILVMVLMAFMFAGDKGVMKILIGYVDVPTLVCILILSLPILARNGLWKDFVRAFKMMNKKYHCSLSDMKRSLDVVELMQKQILCAGILETSFVVIFILGMNENLKMVGVNIAVAVVTILYTAILELLLLPLHVELKRRIIDYMEEE